MKFKLSFEGDAQSSELAMRSSLFSQDDNESVSSEGYVLVQKGILFL